MPYISESRKDAIDRGHMLPSEIGDLTYLFYRESLHYMNRKGESFTNYAHVIGALACTALELYRRRVAVYEEVKRSENGDVA